MGNETSPGARKLRTWMILQSVVIVIISVMTFAWVEYFANVLLGENPDYQPILALGMILPMAALMGTTSYLFSTRINRSLSALIQGIARVADGHFQTRLDLSRGGPLQDAFRNFNKMTTELQNVQTLRDDFIQGFSHEFKTPITSINGFARLLLQVETSPEEQRRYLEVIAAESLRLADLANRTLLLSRLESQQFIVEKESYSLDEQLRRCAILLSPQWTEKGIEVALDLEPVAWLGNPELVQQVWINLLGNAIQVTPARGTIALTLTQRGAEVRVSVTDNGRGMGAEEASRVFLKYYQGDSSRSTQGLGLGLSIAKRIVELSGGRIGVESSPGRGSTFWVVLRSSPG